MRNPEFEEWSAAAQPDGFVDAISWRFRQELPAAFDRLEAGELDVMIDAPSPEDLATLRSAHPDQVVAWPGPSRSLSASTSSSPRSTTSASVRRSTTRSIATTSWISSAARRSSARPARSCRRTSRATQPFCPYTLEPGSGVWSAPDPDRAQALIEEAGAAGEKVDRLGHGEGSRAARIEVMEYVDRVLDELGLRRELEIVHNGERTSTSIFPPVGGSPGRRRGRRAIRMCT